MVPTARRAPCLLLAALATMILLAPPGISAQAAGPADQTAAVDALWDQPQRLAADSALYPVQSAWDVIATRLERDPAQRGLSQLRQANGDLLDAYSVLSKQRRHPGPDPVPILDPLISSIYGAITGLHPRAPLGSILAWLNQVLLTLEGRGSPSTIVENLLRDFSASQKAAGQDLSGGSADMLALWRSNSERQRALLAKIQRLAARTGNAGNTVDLVAAVERDRQDLLKKYVPEAATLPAPTPPSGGPTRPTSTPNVADDEG